MTTVTVTWPLKRVCKLAFSKHTNTALRLVCLKALSKNVSNEYTITLSIK